jgi:hypothetical protein
LLEVSASLFERTTSARPDYYNLPIAVALLRISGQLGTAIARLEKEEEESVAKKVENRGSIPK